MLSSEQLVSEGRVYGGGMFKLEPKELANVDAMAIAELVPCLSVDSKPEQLTMLDDHFRNSFLLKLSTFLKVVKYALDYSSCPF